MMTKLLLILATVVILAQQAVLVYLYYKYFKNLRWFNREYLKHQQDLKRLFERKAKEHLKAFIDNLDNLDARIVKVHQAVLEKALKLGLETIKDRQKKAEVVMEKAVDEEMKALVKVLKAEMDRMKKSEELRLKQRFDRLYRELLPEFSEKIIPSRKQEEIVLEMLEKAKNQGLI
ncbi:MAG: hypothetical protein GXP43_03150 [bacterium]|nr:hypothetical protein [bacterium]